MKRILVIDDDPVFATICANLLIEVGYLVEVAADGLSGMDALRRSQPDLVLLDLHMRKMNGVHVLRQIRSRSATERIPVIAFSGAATSRLVEPIWDAGVNRFLAKDHFEPERFINLVRETLAPSNEIVPPPPQSPTRSALSSSAPPTPSADVFASRRGAFVSLQSELRQAFLKSAAPTLNTLRHRMQSLIKAGDESARLANLREMEELVRAFPDNAGILRFFRIEQFSRLLETLFHDLHAEPGYLTASALHTAARAVELLGDLFEPETVSETESFASVMALVVDDESTSRRMIGSALETANLRSVRLEEPHEAPKLLEENRVDLIVLNLRKPGVTGLELFATIRALPANDTTPVVLVTGRSDYESRAHATLAGSDDFIAEPFLLAELAVKALTHVLGGRSRR